MAEARMSPPCQLLEDKESEMPSSSSTSTRPRPRIDWDLVRSCSVPRPVPVTFVKHEEVEDGYEKFRRVSGKVARSRYDIPHGHRLIVAYSQLPSQLPEPVGVLTYKAGDLSLKAPRKTYNYLDDYYHKISFIFVDRDYQRKGIGSQLIQEALSSMMQAGHDRPVRLEGAKSAVKFFRKMGFISDGKPEVSASRKGSRLFWELYRMQHPAAV